MENMESCVGPWDVFLCFSLNEASVINPLSLKYVPHSDMFPLNGFDNCTQSFCKIFFFSE